MREKMFKRVIYFFSIIQVGVSFAQGPGTISNNLELWLKADIGVVGTTTVSSWQDQSGQSNDATTYGSSTPTIVNSGINYNPSIKFDDDELRGEGGNYSNDYYLVIQPDDVIQASSSPMILFTNRSSSYQGLWTGAVTGRVANEIFLHNISGPRKRALASSTEQFSGPMIINVRHSSDNINMEFFVNGISYPMASSSSFAAVVNQNFSLGRRYTDGNIEFKGDLSEWIAYSSRNSDADQLKITSYLAIKYGITLGHNLVNSNGVEIYSNSSYANDIISIGRDDAQNFLQKQSKSADDSLKIYLGSLAASNNANTTLASSLGSDLSFISIGHNGMNNCNSGISINEKPSTISSRVDREYKIQNTNFSGTFNIDWTLSNCANLSALDLSHLRLMVDNDGDFSNAATYGNAEGISFVQSGNTIQIQGISSGLFPASSIKYLTLGSNSLATPLPVELSDFTAKLEGQKVQLNWQTDSELNNAFFEVQRSQNGILWTKIAQIDGSGNSSSKNNYSSDDNEPHYGVSYYRLKQVDFNGEFQYSWIQEIDYQGVMILNAYPNPIKDVVSLEVNVSGDMTTTLFIYNSLGVPVFSQQDMLLKGYNIIGFDIQFLTNGHYIVKVTSDNRTYSDSYTLLKE